MIHRAQPVSSVRRAFLALAQLVLAALVLFAAPPAWAYTPPPIEGPVTDPGRTLSDADKRILNDKLRRYKTGSGYEIAVFVAPTLDGNTIEDVSYDTARAWGIGKKGKDDGVLLVWAPKERKVRIETGKGVGGNLTDIETFHIQRDRMAPLLKAGRNREALEAGIDGIAAALGGQSAPVNKPVGPTTRKSGGGLLDVLVLFGAIGLFAVIFLLVTLARRRGRSGYRGGGYYDPGPGPIFFGGSSSNDSWSSGGGDSGGSWSSGDSGGGGGGDWGGGGGDFGGGGSSSDY